MKYNHIDPEQCPHVTPDGIPARVSIGDGLIDCALCGDMTTTFLEYMEDHKYVPDAAPYRPSMNSHRYQGDYEFERSVHHEMQSSLFAVLQ